jgi:hypothetical protein
MISWFHFCQMHSGIERERENTWKNQLIFCKRSPVFLERFFVALHSLHVRQITSHNYRMAYNMRNLSVRTFQRGILYQRTVESNSQRQFRKILLYTQVLRIYQTKKMNSKPLLVNYHITAYGMENMQQHKICCCVTNSFCLVVIG